MAAKNITFVINCIQRWGFAFWVTSLTATSLATALCTMLGSYFSELDDAQDEAVVPLQLPRQRRKSRASIVGSDVMVIAPDEDLLTNQPRRAVV
ncbi:hypothetical protein AaE_002897 [Aphanomyces astaci]|uniref:Uncharacterized protein n=1 Tax=Aphanomyces astaci TaxID=112090 RepID=A0A6A5ASV5_APHAT|nr:hypothetical protein AaE_002980 [Aphanomyces astaci]KAF0766785.1 hypothetical protein AaE_002897 [Aphanomyces astaci]